MRLDRRWIESHIPHQGSMCLLEEVLAWDQLHIRCRSSTHRSPDNPLRADGRLGAACGIEYAAQAMAVHGALVASTSTTDSPPLRIGYLASVRNVVLHVTRLDDLQQDLVAIAQWVAGDSGRSAPTAPATVDTVLYEFSVRCGESLLLSGRASIVFAAASGSFSRSGRTST